jgi:N-acetylglucosaminyl-diphospho-decaprenol L-rhamnosyltransferase
MDTLAPLGIVIVHYNTPGLLRGCLASLQHCTVPHQVVVVDNASTDRSVETLPQEFPGGRFLFNAENQGFARANNQGIEALTSSPPGPPPPLPISGEGEGGREAGVRAILLLNPDTVVQPGALEALVAFLESHPRAGASGPRLLNPDGSIQESAFTFPTLWMSFFDFFPLHGRLYYSRLNGRYPEARREEPFPIDHPLGACLLLRGEALAQVGLLDEGYFMYVEEVDLCYRLKQAGWEVWHVPAARVVHHSGQSTRQLPERMLVELHRSRYRLFHKFYPPAFRFAHRRITRLGLWARARQDRRAWREGRLTAEELAARVAAYQEIAAMR